MKNLMKIFIVVIAFAVITNAQFKDKSVFTPSVKDGIISDSPNMFFGFFDANKFSMNHSYSMSYNSFGGHGLALGVYTNNLMYQFADNLNVEVDASIVHSPYNSLGKNFQNQLNGIYLSRAAINYYPWKNFAINIQYNTIPYGHYNSFNNGFNSFRNNPFYLPSGD